jgi:hypothetical protein
VGIGVTELRWRSLAREGIFEHDDGAVERGLGGGQVGAVGDRDARAGFPVDEREPVARVLCFEGHHRPTGSHHAVGHHERVDPVTHDHRDR